MKKPKLVLGTVQLGMKYGLNNKDGQPGKEEAFSILDAALENGIHTFDTAYTYGNAEIVLGDWIKARGLRDKIYVISKMRHHVPGRATANLDIAGEEIKKSLRRLNIGELGGYLLHSPEDIGPDMIASLVRAKQKGLVKNIGASIYTEKEGRKALELGIDYMQIPYNAFDQRLDKGDFFELTKKNQVTVFARSPFLQGLLLMKPDHIPSHLTRARPHVQKFRAIAAEHDLSPIEAALAFVYANPGIQHIVFGVETLPQLQEIFRAAAQVSKKHTAVW